MKDVHAVLRAEEDRVSSSFSLSSFSIRDTRKDTSIHPSYRSVLTFGGTAKPAIAVILNVAKREDGRHVTAISACIGSLVVMPTPFIFSAIDTAQCLWTRLHAELQDAGLSAAPKERQRSLPGSHMVTDSPVTIDVRVENPFFFFLHDVTIDRSPALLLSFAVDCSLSLASDGCADSTLNVLGVRVCRGDPSVMTLPEPGDRDLIRPFDLSANVHLTDGFKGVRGTVSCSDVLARLGIKDVRLMLDALTALVPTSLRSERESTPSWMNEELFSWNVTVYGSMSSLQVVVVNDAKSNETPVVAARMEQFFAKVEVYSDAMKVQCDCTLAADSYVPCRTLWEPLLEEWSVSAVMKREPRERIVGERGESEV